ncbi:ubiquitin carboxyl-terminal hydrolase 20-like [Patiria miniata]|uniref:Ubiquitin carboxyl-terminal hydrolase n=1 Tax=Patiria miniata TaxID=46514 RepID=A0A914AIS9_PATMI|nr:ubiquitin carboxyl-terminal hydrolase 20-like [Patiria miniata]XP_038063637.1 ubiquitin carboxyl-terminal hydrolase 20-like [Patiria miniata]
MGRECPHAIRTAAFHEGDLRQRAQGCCNSCDAAGPNLWMCLTENCGYVGCGEAGSDHSSVHTKNMDHQLNLNLLSFRVWCSACEEEAFPDCVIREGAMEVTQRHRVVVEREVQRVEHQRIMRDLPPKGPSLLPSDSSVTQALDEFFNKDRKPRGLTGLRNLGNTCYISAGIQALSNCPAFTHFFLECGSFVKTEKKPYLAKSYQKLMEEIWGKRRPSYLTPSSLINSIRLAFPMFKGFTQQDTQEFLRCFMDRLHDELKEPLLDQNDNPSGGDDTDAAIERPRRARSNDSLCHSDGEYSSTSMHDNSMASENTSLTSDDASSSPPPPRHSGRQSNVPEPHPDKNRRNWKRPMSESEQDSQPREAGDAQILETGGRGISRRGRTKEDREKDAPEKDVDESEPGREPCNETTDEAAEVEESRGGGQPEDKRFYKVGGHGKLVRSRSHEEVALRVADSNRGKKLSPKYRSIVSDVFDGKILSSVQCLTCDTISTRKETFQDLSLPIPGKEDLARIHKSHSLLAKGVTPCSDAYGKQGWLSWVYSWFSGWIWGPHVTLDNCLAAFFSADDLKGDNMYSCDKCKKLRNGVKFSQVLELPEVLCVHLKRFRHESMSSYSSKINSYVSFPMDGLDMSPYLAKECNNQCYMYDLTAVICHHGTAGGGHYTCYGQNWLNGQWYEYDDMYVTEVSDLQVANCEAYVLFYKKVSDEAVKERQKVSDLFEQHEPSFLHFYVSLQWLNKFNSFAEPGPISNNDFLCKHGGVPPSKASYVDQLVLKVPQPVWEYLHQRYGGGPAVNHLYGCSTCQAEAEQIERRRKDEKETFLRLNEAFSQDDSPDSVIYCISLAWFKTWENFVKAKEKDPPGPIDNRPIAIMKGGHAVLKHGADCGQISKEMWCYLHSIYDGGPEIFLHPNRPSLMDHAQSAMSDEESASPRDDPQSRL